MTVDCLLSLEANCVVIRYGEIFLKGPVVRSRLESKLAGNISHCLQEAGIESNVERIRGRLVVFTNKPHRSCKYLRKVFGIISLSPAISTRSDIQAISDEVHNLAMDVLTEGDTFAINTNRGDKTFEKDSQEINTLIGDLVRKSTGASVDLDDPEVVIGIDIREDSYIYLDEIHGPKGLPLGASGRALSLMSGGIDSPVACYLMMKRGCEQDLIYFDNRPYSSRGKNRRAKAVARVLKSYSCSSGMRFLISPLGEVLTTLIQRCPRELTCTLCKRMMMRVADGIAENRGLEAIINGDSLSQVCSQTMTNLALTTRVTNRPVLMPLIALDKDEIVEIARRIGTYEKSITRVTECQAVPSNPRPRPDPVNVEEAEEALDLDGMVEKTVSETFLIDL